jgi:nucleotide-binding universal stress UspA family protein
MFERIVLATDLSPDWNKILGCAEEFKSLGCERIILTHVIVAKGTTDAHSAASSEVLPTLVAQKKQLESQGFNVIIETPAGQPAFSLNEVARHHFASLIVAGSHGKSALREAVLGSVSNALLHQIQCPVLLINTKRLQVEAQGKPCQLRAGELLRHVLFPTDFSTVANEAIVVLKDLIPRGVNEITLLHALEVMEPCPEAALAPAEAAAKSCLSSLKSDLKSAGDSIVHSHMSQGHPISIILNFLRRGDFSLVVIGTQGRGLVAEIFLGSVAYNIARLAPCPVLLVPQPC